MKNNRPWWVAFLPLLAAAFARPVAAFAVPIG